MKFILSFCSAVLASVVIISFLPVNGESEIYKKTIRLHILAESDSEHDQQVKLALRDELLDVVGDRISCTETYSEAYTLMSECLPEIKKCADSFLEFAGENKTASVELNEEIYPERIYEDVSLPEGKYMSLRVTIGKGEGRNWWCILFPPLCTKAAESEKDFVEAGISSEGYKMIKNDKTPKYKVRFKILEIFSDIFDFNY